MRLVGSNANVTNVTFRNNGHPYGGAPISADLTSSPVIQNVHLENNGTNGLLLDSGDLTADTTWNNADIVYVLRGRVTVPAGVTLTVGPGQIIKEADFRSDALSVAGTLIAQGTVDAPVVFTSYQDDSAASPSPPLARIACWTMSSFATGVMGQMAFWAWST
jgi:hypothetical protein